MKLRRLERVAGACGAILGVATYLAAQSFAAPSSEGWMGDPAIWPQILAGVLVVLSVLLMIWRAGRERTVSFAGAAPGVLMLASGVAYLWALSRAGYFTASALWVASVMLLAGERRWLTVVVTSLSLTAAGYLLFWKVMVIALPVGVVDEWLGFTSLYR